MAVSVLQMSNYKVIIPITGPTREDFMQQGLKAVESTNAEQAESPGFLEFCYHEYANPFSPYELALTFPIFKKIFSYEETPSGPGLEDRLEVLQKAVNSRAFAYVGVEHTYAEKLKRTDESREQSQAFMISGNVAKTPLDYKSLEHVYSQMLKKSKEGDILKIKGKTDNSLDALILHAFALSRKDGYPIILLASGAYARKANLFLAKESGFGTYATLVNSLDTEMINLQRARVIQHLKNDRKESNL